MNEVFTLTLGIAIVQCGPIPGEIPISWIKRNKLTDGVMTPLFPFAC